MTRRSLQLGAVVAALALTTACGSSVGTPDPAAPVPVSVTVTNATETYTVPWLVGMDQGFFARRGVEVTEVVPGQGGSSTLRNLISGDLAVADVSYPAVVEAAVEGSPVTAVGGGYQSLYGLDFYTLAANPAVQTVADVRRWGFTNPGSVTESLTYLIPQRAGLADQPVERVATGGVGEGVALLEGGRVDVAIVPDAVRARSPEKFRLVAASSDYLQVFQQTAITTTTDYADDNPEVVRALLAGYAESAAWIAGNVDAAGALYARYTGLPLEAAVAAVRSAQQLDSWSAGTRVEGLTAAGEAMTVAGFEGEIPYCELFDPQFAPPGTALALPVAC